MTKPGTSLRSSASPTCRGCGKRLELSDRFRTMPPHEVRERRCGCGVDAVPLDEGGDHNRIAKRSDRLDLAEHQQAPYALNICFFASTWSR